MGLEGGHVAQEISEGCSGMQSLVDEGRGVVQWSKRLRRCDGVHCVTCDVHVSG